MPDPDLKLRSEFLFDMESTAESPRDMGRTPPGLRRDRRQFPPGLRMKGIGEPTLGGDWLLQRANGLFEFDARATLCTDDDALVFMRYRGSRNAAPRSQCGGR